MSKIVAPVLPTGALMPQGIRYPFRKPRMQGDACERRARSAGAKRHHRKKEAPEEVAPRASGCPPRLLPDPARTEGAATRASGYARRKSGQATVDGCGKRA